MIKKLEIKNFQSHKDSSFDFVPGINIIIGSSDSGKSAALRALNWAVNNKPSGDDFRSSWGGDSCVDITLDNLDVISREKGKGNIYVVSSDKGKKPQEFKAFGNDVPEPIKKLLNFEEINFQFQLDSPFLLSSTAGEVAKYLNQVVNLERIDSSLYSIEKSRREILKKTAFLENALEDKKKQLTKYDYLENMESKIEAIENKWKEIDLLTEKYNEISTALGNINLAKKELRDNERSLPDAKTINKLISKAEDLESMEADYNILLTRINLIQDLEKQLIKVVNNKMKLTREFADNMPKECPLCGQEIK